MGLRSGIRLDVHRSAAVGLAAVSLRRMGVRAGNRLGLVVVWIWQRLPVAALDGSVCAQAARADWRGADPSAGQARANAAKSSARRVSCGAWSCGTEAAARGRNGLA